MLCWPCRDKEPHHWAAFGAEPKAPQVHPSGGRFSKPLAPRWLAPAVAPLRTGGSGPIAATGVRLCGTARNAPKAALCSRRANVPYLGEQEPIQRLELTMRKQAYRERFFCE